MMDAQEKSLEQENIKEEPATACSAPSTNEGQEPEAVESNPNGGTAEDGGEKEAETATPAAEEPARPVYKTKKEVLNRVKEIAHSEDAPRKEEIDHLKSIFYKMLLNEREAEQRAFIENGGQPEDYRMMPDEDEETFKAEMGIIKEKRAKLLQQQEQEKQDNLQKKLDIIEKIKAMATSPDEANKSYQEFKDLQQQWKEIKNVPADKANELWRNYQLYVENFYDLLKLNSEAREYDFKKNLEIKTHLCEAAEKLADEPDVISAFHQLQKLHQEYRETGPVAKELREEIWARFKAASTVINKKHQQYFDDQRVQEEENLKKKTALCEKVEALHPEEYKRSAEWDKHSKEVIALQAEWKGIGFAPQKMNVKIYERFRTACDKFFSMRNEYFKALREEFNTNADRKQALIDKANALKDSTDWRTTGEQIMALQKEWKEIGPVAKKQSDELWEQFTSACNHFFEARKAAGSEQKAEERENLKKKRSVVQQLKDLTENATENVQDTIHKLVAEYNAIGHVPFKEKDKIYEEYRTTLDEVYKKLNLDMTRQRLDTFKTDLKTLAQRGAEAIDNERGRLVRRRDALKQEIQTYENNLGFLSASSKKGNSLIDEMNRKVQKLKDDMELVKQKIKAIDKENKANQ